MGRPEIDEVSVTEIPKKPNVIGIEFLYTDTVFKKDFCGYTFIYAENEAQAREYYNTHLKGSRYWFDAGVIDPTGKCIRGEIVQTYFAACPGYDFDAIRDKKESPMARTK